TARRSISSRYSATLMASHRCNIGERPDWWYVLDRRSNVARPTTREFPEGSMVTRPDGPPEPGRPVFPFRDWQEGVKFIKCDQSFIYNYLPTSVSPFQAEPSQLPRMACHRA